MYKCPSCGSSEIMSIRAEVDANIDSRGQLECRCDNMEISEMSRVDCGMCGHHGAARTFTYPDPPAEHKQFGMTKQGWGQFLDRMGFDENEKSS